MIELNPVRARIADLTGRPDALRGIFDYDAKRERLEEVERELENPDIWNDPERAQALGRERSMLDKTVNGIRDLKDGPAARANCSNWPRWRTTRTPRWRWSPTSTATEGRGTAGIPAHVLHKMDSANAFVDIQAGAGGTEAQDWARCCCACTCAGPNREGLEDRLLEASGGEVAGSSRPPSASRANTPTAG